MHSSRLGFRVRGHRNHKFNFTQLLVHVQTFLVVGLILSSTIVVTLGLVTESQCYAAIETCVVFYTAFKATL
jgi:hypothetical protein